MVSGRATRSLVLTTIVLAALSVWVPFGALARHVPQGASASKTIGYEDLAEIAELGARSNFDDSHIAVSPDEKWAAIELAQPSVARNLIERRWRFVSLTSPFEAKDAGISGEPTLVEDRRPQYPLWLPDSRSFVFKGEFDGSIQLWVAAIGQPSRQLTHASNVVGPTAISLDRKRIIYFTQRTGPEGGHSDDEALRGYLFDERFAPMLKSKPIIETPAEPGQWDSWSYDIASKSLRPAAPQDRALIIRSYERTAASEKMWERASKDGRVSVWLADASGRSVSSMGRRSVITIRNGSNGNPQPCASDACAGYMKGLWLSEDGRTVYFLRWRGPHSYGAIGLYALKVGEGVVREILQTEDSLEACALASEHLICGYETPTMPNRLVMIGLKSAEIRVIYDPNPKFGEFEFGEVRTLTWMDEDKTEGFARLVKPVGWKSGKRYPLVICQYRSRGFLRGGTGDECPIHVLSANGFMVLSFHRPDDWVTRDTKLNSADSERALWRGLRDRRRVASVLAAVIKQLEHEGLIDPQRVGIHGLSDGAATVAFMLIHSPQIFAVASVAGTEWNPGLFFLVLPMLKERMALFGLPLPRYDGIDPQWRDLSLSVNAESINTPLLIQVADSELLTAAETFTALRGFEKPVEMHVFPEEFHVKVQPAHKEAVYRRNVQWFKFWLQGTEDLDPVDGNQYARWRRLREARSDASAPVSGAL